MGFDMELLDEDWRRIAQGGEDDVDLETSVGLDEPMMISQRERFAVWRQALS